MNFGRKDLFTVIALGVVAATAGMTEGQAATTDIRVSSDGTRHGAVCPVATAAQTARCHARVVVNDADQPETTAAPSGYSPADLRSAYVVTGNGNLSTIVAIVDAFGYPNAESDLATYRSQFGLPACTTANGCFKKVNQNGQQGNYPAFNLGWAQETALDLDMASAMCPGCSILLVEATTNSFQNLGIAETTAAAMGAHAISNSYGGGEGGSQTYEPFYTHAGIAVTVSSGDSGYGVQFPASSPHVTAVGGTRLVRGGGGRGWTETAWSGAGSGCSTVYAKPVWQTDTGCSKRTVADVSAVSDPSTGVAVYGPIRRNRSGWLVFGGTSVAAPLIAGVYGVNATAVNYGGDPYGHTANLYDITSGSNGSCGGSYLCTAKVGYDGPTGLGTPNGVNAFGH
jgi:subtilase family serine protease